jgi:Rrf2 family protein
MHMNLLNRKIDNALLILCYLHHNPDGGCAREIASHFRLSRAFVANILKDLCHKGFVTSERGIKGGYIISSTTANLRLADLLDVLDNSTRLAECNQSHPEECCSLVEICPIRGPIEEVHWRLRRVLESVTLGEIFGKSIISELPLKLEPLPCI